MVEKIEVLYEKYNPLLTRQESEVSVNVKRLSDIKNQMCDDMSKQLDSANFEEISNDPVIVAQMRKVYEMVKQKSSSSDSDRSSSSRPNSGQNGKRTPLEGRPELVRENSVTIGSFKSKANIREVYSLVMNKTAPNPSNDDSDVGEITIPPPTKFGKTQPLPPKMVDKINSLVTPFFNQTDYLAQDDQLGREDNETIINPTEEFTKMRNEINKLSGLLDKLSPKNSLEPVPSRKNSKGFFNFPEVKLSTAFKRFKVEILTLRP